MLTRWLFGVVLLLLVSGLAVTGLLRASLPEAQGQASLSGLDAPVDLYYDEWERPFVDAHTQRDALQVQGWLHGSHRLWQMELLRRAGSGRLAELLGVDFVEADITHWRAGVPQLAQRLQANTSAATRELVDGYLQGVNAAIEASRVFPPEFLLLRASPSRWTHADVFAVGALMAWQSANNLSNELVRLALAGVLDGPHNAVFTLRSEDETGYPFILGSRELTEGALSALDRLSAVDPAFNGSIPRLGFGSNGWVVAAKRTEEGAPLYAFDSHDELGLPNLFYEVHLFFGEGRQIRGWSTPGMPGVINGFNERIAWGFTNIGDTQDLFVEERSADDALLFRDGQEWYRAETTTHLLPVAGSAPVSFDITTTRNGPLLSEDPPLSLAWAVQRVEQPDLDSLLALNTATGWASFNTALDQWPAPTLNATYADVEGTIGFRTAGVLPMRGRGNGRAPMNGADPAQRWQGLVDVQEMPRRKNPETAFLAAANAAVYRDGDGPLVSADNAAPYRIARIQSVLSGGGAHSVKSMQALQLDWTDGQALQLLPVLLAETDKGSLTSLGLLSRELLQDWLADPLASPDSAAALIFQHWYVAIAHQVFAQRTGEIWPRLQRRSYLLNSALDSLILGDGDSVWWRGNRPVLLSLALNSAVRGLQAARGSAIYRWKLADEQTVAVQHPLSNAVPGLGRLLNKEPQPWGGSPATVGRAGYGYHRPNTVTHAATVRTVGVLSSPPRFYSIIPGGQSGHPLSDHYTNQFESWLQGELNAIAADTTVFEAPSWRFTPAPGAAEAGSAAP